MSATPDNTLTDPEQLIADLQLQLAECRAERDEALHWETAAAEVLQVINSSPGDLTPVLKRLSPAARVCEAEFSAVARFGRWVAPSGGRPTPVAGGEGGVSKHFRSVHLVSCEWDRSLPRACRRPGLAVREGGAKSKAGTRRCRHVSSLRPVG
jgi:hypothetical protein